MVINCCIYSTFIFFTTMSNSFQVLIIIWENQWSHLSFKMFWFAKNSNHWRNVWSLDRALNSSYILLNNKRHVFGIIWFVITTVYRFFLPTLLYSQHPHWLVIIIIREVINVHGGMLLGSLSIDDLFTMSIPTSPRSIQSHSSKAYVGRIEDIYPFITKYGSFKIWYGGQCYFKVISHAPVIQSI